MLSPAILLIVLLLSALTPTARPIPPNNHGEIARALTRLYEFFLEIGYITEEQMRWPPHNATTLDRDLCRSKGLSSEAIVFLETIPFTTSRNEIAFKSNLLDYSDEADLEACRHPELAYDQPSELNPLLDGWMVPLAAVLLDDEGHDGHAYIVDTNKGKYYPGTWPAEESQLTFPSGDFIIHYADSGNLSPVEYIDHLYDRVTSLELLPVGGMALTESYDYPPGCVLAYTALL